MTDDFYDLLEIPPDASQDEIKDAYREQVRVYHPDLNDDDRAQAQFTAIKTAYDILGDPVERRAYDRLGHEEYVAKRTSGLPSPDVWQSDDEDDSSDTKLSYSESKAASASASASTASSATAGSAATGSTANRSSSTVGSSGGTVGASATSTGTASGASSATGTGTAGRTGSKTSGRTGRSRGTGSRSGSDTGNPLARWWRRQNFSLPLLWLSILVYGAGLGHFGFANADALGSLWTELRGIGADPAGVWALLSEGRHGLETGLSFVQGVEFVSPSLEQPLWYGALAGVVALALGGLLAVRVTKREDTRGPVTIDETIVVALALTATTTLVGGPLLAGAVLMPFLFGVVVRHTRRGPGWKPSYLYLLPVLAPLAGFGAAAAGSTSLPVDLAAFVILPVVGGLGLPARATVKKHFGW